MRSTILAAATDGELIVLQQLCHRIVFSGEAGSDQQTDAVDLGTSIMEELKRRQPQEAQGTNQAQSLVPPLGAVKA